MTSIGDKTLGDKTLVDDDRALEELLGRASPRPTPPDDAMKRVKAAVEEEWRQQHRRRVTRRRFTALGLAATVVLGVAVVMNTWLAPAVPPVHVATLEKSIGTIYLLGGQGQLLRADNLEAVRSGQTIATAGSSGAGLKWGAGGSLRLDENTEVMFTSEDTIELKSGQVYFDSEPTGDTAAALKIVTELGDVSHLGTQFTTSIDRDTLTVRVREGKVAIDGRFYEHVAEQGKEIRLVGSRRPQESNIPVFGPQWEWIEATTPVAAMEGRKLYDFLVWVGRETGLTITFESDDVERAAKEAFVLGDASDIPRVALHQRLMTANLACDIDNGMIRIRQASN